MKKLIIPALVAVVSISALGLSASKVYADDATGGQGQGFRKGFNSIAEFLGMTTEELQSAKDEGNTTEDLILSQGKTKEEFEAYMESKATERMQQNDLSEEEIAERMELRAQRESEGCTGEPKGPSEFSMGQGRRLNQ